MEKVVDATLARRQLGTILDEVYYKGESIIIERKGKPLAKIVPLNTFEADREGPVTRRQQDLIAELNSLPVFEMKEEPTDILRKLRQDRAARAKGQYDK